MQIKDQILKSIKIIRFITGYFFLMIFNPFYNVNGQTNLKPNIIVIISDDQGYGQASCYPMDVPVGTPNIDRLAKTGIRLTDGYSQHPMCWPSRASILTGKYHQRFRHTQDLPKEERFIGNYLWDAGYVTGCIGKWHNSGSLGEWDGQFRNHPEGRGFDSFYGFIGGMHDYWDPDLGTVARKPPLSTTTFMPIYDGIERDREVEYSTTKFTRSAIDFIKQHKEEPFFLYLSYNAIHTPFQAPDEYLEKQDGDSQEDVLHAMLEVMDDGIGEVLNTLEDLGLRENTLVLFVSDNGGFFPGGNWILRGFKSDRYEGGIRVPWVVSWPAVLEQNIVFKKPAMHIDILPTVVAAASGKISEERPVDGVNLLPYFKGEKAGSPHEALFWQERDRFAVRRGEWKLIRERDNRNAPLEVGLYNLNDDPGEKNNLIHENRKESRELLELYNEWISDIYRNRGKIEPLTMEKLMKSE